MLPALGGYLVSGSSVHLGRVEKFIKEVGKFEDAIFGKRMRMLQRQRDRVRHQKRAEAARAAAKGGAAAAAALKG